MKRYNTKTRVSDWGAYRKSSFASAELNRRRIQENAIALHFLYHGIKPER
jgi:hypothetical protein